MKLTQKIITDIAQELDSGMKVYINRDNFEFKTILDWEDCYDDNGFWEEELETIEKEWSDYLVISKMESWEAFQVMKSFIDTVNDKKFKEILKVILSGKSPFANFKTQVESSPFRQSWFDFRQMKCEEYVKAYLKLEGVDYE